jgi:hypothetical protein
MCSKRLQQLQHKQRHIRFNALQPEVRLAAACCLAGAAAVLQQLFLQCHETLCRILQQPR